MSAHWDTYVSDCEDDGGSPATSPASSPQPSPSPSPSPSLATSPADHKLTFRKKRYLGYYGQPMHLRVGDYARLVDIQSVSPGELAEMLGDGRCALPTRAFSSSSDDDEIPELVGSSVNWGYSSSDSSDSPNSSDSSNSSASSSDDELPPLDGGDTGDTETDSLDNSLYYTHAETAARLHAQGVLRARQLEFGGLALAEEYQFTYSPKFQATALPEDELFLRAFAGHAIEVVGLVGAGKTGFLLSLIHFMKQRHLQHRYFREKLPMDLFNAFIAGHRTVTEEEPYNPHAFPFQEQMLVNRTAVNLEAQQCTAGGVACWIDGGLGTDFTFACMMAQKQHMSSDEWHRYLAQVPAANTVDPSLVIVLDCPPTVCLERQRVRQRAGEDVYDLEYMVRLRDTYAYTLSKMQYNILVVDWSEDLSDRMALHASAQVQDNEYKNGQCLLPEARIMELLRLVYAAIAPPPPPRPSLSKFSVSGGKLVDNRSPLRHRLFRGGNGKETFSWVHLNGADRGILY